MKFEELKSGVLLDTQDKIIALMEERRNELTQTKSGEPLAGPGLMQTSFETRSDGSLKITKANPMTPRAIGTGAPAMPDSTQLAKLFKARGMEYVEGYAERCIPYWASDETVDSYGDIIKQAGWEFDAFTLNSPMPWDHDWYSPPIGKNVDWKVVRREADNYKGPALWVLSFFASPEMSEKADSIYRLVKAGILTSGSVGFRPLEVLRVEDEDERQKLGLGRWGVVYLKQQLLEFSSTTIGANRSAHTLAQKAAKEGKLVPMDLMMLREINRKQVARGNRSITSFSELELAVLDIGRSLWPDLRKSFVPHSDLDTSLFFDSEVQAVMRAEIPDEDVSTVKSTLTAIQNAVNEFGSNVATAVEDIRQLLENNKPDDQPDNEDIPTPVDDSSSDSADKHDQAETLQRLCKSLEVLDNCTLVSSDKE